MTAQNPPRHFSLGRKNERVFLLLHNGHYYAVLWAYDDHLESFRVGHPFLNFVITDSEPPLFMWEHYKLAYAPEFVHLSALVNSLDDLHLDAAHQRAALFLVRTIEHNTRTFLTAPSSLAPGHYQLDRLTPVQARVLHTVVTHVWQSLAEALPCTE